MAERITTVNNIDAFRARLKLAHAANLTDISLIKKILIMRLHAKEM